MVELVAKVGIIKEKGYKYFIDDNGHISRKDSKGKIECVHRVGIRKKPGFQYFIDDTGNVSCFKGDEKDFQIFQKSIPKVPEGSLINRKVRITIHVPFGQETHKGMVINENKETISILSGFWNKRTILYKNNITKIEILN